MYNEQNAKQNEGYVVRLSKKRWCRGLIAAFTIFLVLAIGVAAAAFVMHGAPEEFSVDGMMDAIGAGDNEPEALVKTEMLLAAEEGDGHVLELVRHKAPTCTEEGHEDYYKCSCGSPDHVFNYVVIPALGHGYEEHEAKPVTCTEIGWDAYRTCWRCDYTEYEEIPAPGHEIVKHEAQAATCTEIGWNAYECCDRCDYTTYKQIAALGHALEKHEAKLPTCTEDGHYAYENCTRCDYTTHDAIPKLGHNLETVAAQAPTCTEIGWDEYEFCKRCDHTTYEKIEALDHDLEKYTALPHTCTTDGYFAYEACKREGCGHTTYKVDPAAHSLTVYPEKKATCTEDGWRAYEKCTACEYSTYDINFMPRTDHTIIVVEEREPTCMEPGYCLHMKCLACDYVLDYEIIPATGHDLQHIDAQAPTCTEDGWRAYDGCANCDYNREAYLIPATGHTWVFSETLIASTCESDGLRLDACRNCDAKNQVKTDMLGHDLITHEAKAQNYKGIGWDAYQTCSRCDYTTYEELPMLGELKTIFGITYNTEDHEQLFYLFIWGAIVLLAIALILLACLIARAISIGAVTITICDRIIIRRSGVFLKKNRIEEFYGVLDVACTVSQPHKVGDIRANCPTAKNGKLIFEGVCDANELFTYLKGRIVSPKAFARTNAAQETLSSTNI